MKKNKKKLLDIAVSAHKKYQSQLPDKKKCVIFLENILELLFPHFSDKSLSEKQAEADIKKIEKMFAGILQPLYKNKKEITGISDNFFSKLADVHEMLNLDAQAICDGDPAAKSVDEVIITYPGFFAVAVYRIAHELYILEVPVIPRLLTEYAHQLTGIDINPGAVIGKNFCIDHGTGIVIGETTEIGDNVKLYQGVTLGALSVKKELASKKRHPTIENNVVIYANSTILGGATIIGHDSIIGGNVWLTKGVKPNSVVYYEHEPKHFIRNQK